MPNATHPKDPLQPTHTARRRGGGGSQCPMPPTPRAPLKGMFFRFGIQPLVSRTRP
ncbi:MAG: hypothetical protein F6J93_11760 [Oscillatoria sp. SIO1A7]|nr:hypothetical protein [Oscillatoria sp. SIO1A7]